MPKRTVPMLILMLLATPLHAAETQLLWGDTHHHSNLSPDAYLLENRSATPDDAYNYAKGRPIIHPYNRARIRIETPLDFLVMTDHSEYVGVMPRVEAADPAIAASERGAALIRMFQEGDDQGVFNALIRDINNNDPDPILNSAELRGVVWNEIAAAADRHNDPGTFTSFIGWEWSSLPQGNNLHRVIFTASGAEDSVAINPFSSFDSDYEEDLWAWLDETSADTGLDFMVIAHNSNISGGMMFNDVRRDGSAIDADYARSRMRWEPVHEMTQIKGDSETHPDLSPDDEFADFETYEHRIEAPSEDGSAAEHSADPGDYMRTGLLRGIEIEERVGENPYQLGMIGSTDAHTSAASAEEDNFWGKFAIDSVPDNGTRVIIAGAVGWDMSASGLAAVWAEENTREAIFDAFRRREVYGTTGPRIQLRVFGGWEFKNRHARARDLAAVGYERGVPMGGELATAAEGDAPSFLIHAVRDPVGGNLDRIQVVKGWVGSDGMAHERVYDVEWAGDRELGADGRLPAIGNTVDLESGEWTNDIGAPELATVWEDPDFDAAQRAFYYVRVLQIPTPRHSLYDAIALGIDPAETGHPSTIQERAYSSPIWYTP